MKGKFSRNEKVPRNNHSPCIINLDDLIGLGTHWVCCWKRKKDGIYEWFDSFGIQPPEEWLEINFSSQGGTYVRNDFRIQKFDSVRCGWYCLMFLSERNNGTSYEEFLSVFGNEDQNKNEKIPKKYFTNIKTKAK